MISSRNTTHTAGTVSICHFELLQLMAIYIQTDCGAWCVCRQVFICVCTCVCQTCVGPVSHKAIKGRVSGGMCDRARQRGEALARRLCVCVCAVRVINKRKLRGTNNEPLLVPSLDSFTRSPPSSADWQYREAEVMPTQHFFPASNQLLYHWNTLHHSHTHTHRHEITEKQSLLHQPAYETCQQQ